MKARALYHACKAKRDGLQDRCKTCRADLDKLRLEQARSNNMTPSGGGGSAIASSRHRSAGLASSGSTPTSHVSSACSPKRRSMRSGSSSGHRAGSPLLSFEARPAVTAADATSIDDRSLKRRRYPNWNLPAELNSESQPPSQPLPQLLKCVPRYFIASALKGSVHAHVHAPHDVFMHFSMHTPLACVEIRTVRSRLAPVSGTSSMFKQPQLSLSPVCLPTLLSQVLDSDIPIGSVVQ